MEKGGAHGIQRDEDGRIARQDEPDELAQRIDGQIDVAGAGAGPHRLGSPDPMLGCVREAEQLRRLLDVDARLVMVSWVESDVPLETLQALVEVLPATKRETSESRAIAAGKAGFTAMDVREFGATLCETPFTPGHLTALRESGVSTKVIRALHAALRYGPDRALEVYPALAREGITTTAAARSMRKFAAGTEKDWGYIAARVPTGDLEQWAHTLRTSTERDRHLITRQDAKDIADLAHHGIDHDSLVTLAHAGRGEANRHADRPDAARPLAWFVDLAHAGVDAERSALLARCGIPTSRQALHAQDADPWAAGAPYRERYESEERRLAGSWAGIHGPARTWAFTRDEALAGPQPAVSA